jgi:hypothetical protein
MKMKHLLITTIAAAVLLLFGGVNEVNGDPLTYEVVGDTVTIKDCKKTASGALVIPSTYEGRPVTNIGNYAFYGCSRLTSVTIPDSVTSIRDHTFQGCSSLTSVTIPDSVTSIGENAFFNCSSLTSVTIPDSVTSIGNSAFQGCNSLETIGVVDGNSEYTSQGGVLFDKNKTTLIQYPASKKNDHYSIPDSVTSIGDTAFWGCSSLASVTIPDSVTSIASGAFYGCSSLTSVTISDSVTSLGDHAFAYCSSLTSVTIGNSVTSIENGAFYGCSRLTNVTIPESVTSIGDDAFNRCSSLTSVTIPDSVTSLGGAAFASCSGLTSVTIPDSVTSIGRGAFIACSRLTSIAFEGNAPFSFGVDVFSQISEDAKIFVIPGATGFGETFAGLPVVLEANTAIYLDGEYSSGKDVKKTESAIVSLFTHFPQGEIFYTLDGTKPTFTSAPYTTPFQLAESATIRAIAYSSSFTESTEAEPVNFRTLTTHLLSLGSVGGGTINLGTTDRLYIEGTEVTLTAKPEAGWQFISWSVDSTSSEATITITMNEAKALTPIFGTNVTVNEIGAGKVVQTPSNPVAYGSTVTFTAKPDIGHYLFRWAGEQKGNDTPTQLQITKPNPVVSGLFAEYNPLDFLKFEVEGDTIAVIGCDKNASGALVIPSTYEEKPVTSIGDSAFGQCSSLTSVTIPDSVTYIGEGAFYNCSSLTSVTIPDSVTSIGSYAFRDCSSLTSITIPASVTSIGSQTFLGCSSLTSVTIPDSVISIGDYAFYNCSGLTSVTIGDSVTSIGKNAFRDCRSLTSITFGGNAPDVGDYVFLDVSENAKIIINPGATGFGETFAGLPVVIQERIEINTFSKSDSPFTISFESKSGSTYIIEVTQDFKQWSEIGEVQGTGSSVKFTDWREAIFQKQYYRVKLVE